MPINLKFINSSDYDIQELIFTSGNSKHDTIAILANNSSPIYELNFKKVWQEYVSEPFIIFQVKAQLDNQKNLNFNTAGISRSDLKQENLNEILISFDSINKRFNFKLKN